MWQIIRFSEIEAKIKNKPGIYEIHTDNGIALKVGIGVDLRERLLQHRASRQSGLKLKSNGKWENPTDVDSKKSILAKHLYYDDLIAPDCDLKSQTGRQKFLDERCYIVAEMTETMAEALNIEKQLETEGKYRYLGTVHNRSAKDAKKMTCECGCGETTTSGSFKPGHDQKLRADIERRVGGLLALRSLVEAAERFARQSQPEAFTSVVRSIFKATDT